MIWHIIKKDARLLWLVIIANAVLQLVAAPLGIKLLTTFNNTPTYNIVSDMSRMLSLVSLAFVRAGGMTLLIILVVQQDSLLSVRQDWLTRPVLRRDLLLAKLLFILIVVQGPMLLANLLAVLAWPAGLSVTDAIFGSLLSFISFSLPMVIVASVTQNIRRTAIVLLLLFLVIVPYLYFTGYGAVTKAAHNGTMPLVVAAQFVVILIAALIVLPLQYFRRNTRLAAIILAPLSLIYLSVPFLPWPTSFAIQKNLSSQPNAAATVSLSYDTEPEDASGSAFGNVKVPLRVAGLSEGDILLARDEEVRLLDADGKTLYDDKQYQEKDFDTVNEELWPEWRQDGAGDIHTYAGLNIPDTLYGAIKDRKVRVEVAYSLILLKKGLGGRLRLPDGTQNIPGLGACTAGYAGGFKGIVDVSCVNPASNGQCETYFVENISTGQRQPLEQNCYPDITPAPLRWVRLSSSILFGFVQPQQEVLVEGFLGYVVPGSGLDLSQVAKSRLVITSYNPAAYFTRTVKSPLLLLGDLKGLKAGKKNYEQSLADYKQSLQQSAAEDATFRAGINAYKRKDWNEVITDFSAAIQLNPKDADAFHNRGDAYLANSHYDKAIADYSDAIRLDPKDSDSLTGRGNAYFSKKLYGKAVTDYDQAIRINPKDSDALGNRCFVKGLQNKDLDMGLADCNASLKLAPKSSGTLESRGLVYFRRGDFQKSIADCDAALQIDSKDTAALYLRGIAKIRTKNTASGHADIAAALAMDPKAGDDMTKAGIKP